MSELDNRGLFYDDEGSEGVNPMEPVMSEPGTYGNRSRTCAFCGAVAEWRGHDPVPAKCSSCGAPAREASEPN